MPRPFVGPRLYLDRKRQTWAIRDGQAFVRTGCREDQREKATLALQRYVSRTRSRKRWERTIYFVTCEVEAFPIKIGISTDINERMRDIRTSLPYPVRLLASMPGTSLDECAIQTRFAHLRLNGEWFRPEPDLLGFIAGIPVVSVPTLCQDPNLVCELEEISP